MKYKDGSLIKVGDIFTDGSSGVTHIRTKNRAKVLYVDKFTLVWFPLNDFTVHTLENKYTSRSWHLSSFPIKIDIGELTEEELEKYNTASKIIEVNN